MFNKLRIIVRKDIHRPQKIKKPSINYCACLTTKMGKSKYCNTAYPIIAPNWLGYNSHGTMLSCIACGNSSTIDIYTAGGIDNKSSTYNFYLTYAAVS